MIESFTTGDGVRLSVRESGSGPAILFQHGLCGDALQPAGVFPDDCGWRCVTIECRGHGNSGAGDPAGFSIAAFANDIASRLDAQHATPLAAGGISMGAAIALRLACIRPDLVRALVLARPAWLDAAAPENMRPNAIVGDLLKRYTPDEARRRFEDSDLARRLAVDSPDNLNSLRGFFSREPRDVTAELLTRISADGAGVAKEQIRSLTQPALVIGNARDSVHPLALAQELASLLPASRFVEITSKSASRERYREEFRSALKTFLEEMHHAA